MGEKNFLCKINFPKKVFIRLTEVPRNGILIQFRVFIYGLKYVLRAILCFRPIFVERIPGSLNQFMNWSAVWGYLHPSPISESVSMNSPVYLLVWEQIVWDCLAGLIQTVSVDIRGSILQNLVMCFENLYTIVIICGKDLSLTSNF